MGSVSLRLIVVTRLFLLCYVTLSIFRLRLALNATFEGITYETVSLPQLRLFWFK